jgi:hypothetical protein
MDQCDFPLLFPNIAKIAGYVVLDGLERKEYFVQRAKQIHKTAGLPN